MIRNVDEILRQSPLRGYFIYSTMMKKVPKYVSSSLIIRYDITHKN